MTREYLVFSPKIQGTQVVKTEAKTWEEFEKELTNMGLYTNAMAVFCKETKQNLKMIPKAELPVGKGEDMNGLPNGYDGTIILSISKTESGASPDFVSIKEFMSNKKVINRTDKDLKNLDLCQIMSSEAFFIEKKIKLMEKTKRLIKSIN